MVSCGGMYLCKIACIVVLSVDASDNIKVLLHLQV